MKRISISPRQPEVVDVEDVRELGRRPWFRSTRFASGIMLALIAFAAVAWWTYAVYLKPSRDRQLVDETSVILLARPDMSEWSSTTKGWSSEQRLISLSELFLEEELGVSPTVGRKASRAALDLAIQSGGKEARLILGEFLRDGKFGQKDSKAALAQFQIVLNEIQTGIQTSDQDALYISSIILKGGLGVEADPVKAREILKRVALTREAITMQRIGWDILSGKLGDPDFELVKAISKKLTETGDTTAYVLGTSACYKQLRYFDDSDALDIAFDSAFISGDLSSARETAARMRARHAKLKNCRLPFLQAGASGGDRDAIEELAEEKPPASFPNSQVATIKAPPRDPEVQSRTGYLDGTKQITKGGLSTFKVDNTKGGGDAVVRLYRDGKKPAARSMFVKNGESFTADAVAPGAYRMRYRYIGSGDTYEAEETFTLSETATDTGTRFSRVKVTLYKVANGNMTVKKVDANEF